MTTIDGAVDRVLEAQAGSGKPLAVVLAGHNGSGKSTLWHWRLAERIQIPLINADRMMLSILPEASQDGKLPLWARNLRDHDTIWMQVAQDGVQAFVSHAMARLAPFAMETVFSHWRANGDGTFESKIDRILEMQANGYFVLLLFVGLASKELSIARVNSRVTQGGHDVPANKLEERFPRTQKAIGAASTVADATIMVDNSRSVAHAFAVCRVQLKRQIIFDLRTAKKRTPLEIMSWLPSVCPNV